MVEILFGAKCKGYEVLSQKLTYTRGRKSNALPLAWYDFVVNSYLQPSLGSGHGRIQEIYETMYDIHGQRLATTWAENSIDTLQDMPHASLSMLLHLELPTLDGICYIGQAESLSAQRGKAEVPFRSRKPGFRVGFCILQKRYCTPELNYMSFEICALELGSARKERSAPPASSAHGSLLALALPDSAPIRIRSTASARPLQLDCCSGSRGEGCHDFAEGDLCGVRHSDAAHRTLARHASR